MEPTTLNAGDSVSWSRAVPEYPAEDGWTLHYALRGPAALQFDAIGGDAGDWKVELEASRTAKWLPGRYRLAAFVSRNDERYTIANADLTVVPDWLTAENVDARTHPRRMLDLIEAALEKRIPKDMASYEIDGQRIDRIPIGELMKLRTIYRAEVQRESRRGQSPLGRTIAYELG